MNKIKKIAMVLAVSAVAITSPVMAASLPNACDESSVAPSAACGSVDDESALKVMIGNITKTLLLIVGVLSVAMIIFGGIRYITSGGDKKRIESAKNILIYSITGLIVALVAGAVIGFVMERVIK